MFQQIIFRTKYNIYKDHIEFMSYKSLIKNTPINFKGKIYTSPFSFKVKMNAKDIDLRLFI